MVYVTMTKHIFAAFVYSVMSRVTPGFGTSQYA